MYDFNFHHPSSIESALALFGASDDPVYLAGGHTLVPSMKQRLRAPSDVIDLSGIEVLRTIREEGDTLQIGSLARHAEVARSIEVASHAPVLSALASGIGDRQVRNRGTIGGSVANNDPAADYPAAVLGLGMAVQTDRRTIACLLYTSPSPRDS